jgi:hypothetical protein
MEIDQLLSQATMRPPCPPDELTDFVKIVGPIPHQDYLGFMSRCNGCDGPIGNEGYVSLWSLDEVVASTEKLCDEFAPGLLLFGGDGGNGAFAFDRSDPTWPIVVVPLIGMSRKEMRVIDTTFSGFIRRLAEDDLWE